MVRVDHHRWATIISRNWILEWLRRQLLIWDNCSVVETIRVLVVCWWAVLWILFVDIVTIFLWLCGVLLFSFFVSVVERWRAKNQNPNKTNRTYFSSTSQQYVLTACWLTDDNHNHPPPKSFERSGWLTIRTSSTTLSILHNQTQAQEPPLHCLVYSSERMMSWLSTSQHPPQSGLEDICNHTMAWPVCNSCISYRDSSLLEELRFITRGNRAYYSGV